MQRRVWELINFEEGSVNCPFCEIDLKPQIRQDSQEFTWNVHNISRHLERFHQDKKGKGQESTDDDDDSYFEPTQMLDIELGIFPLL